VEIHFGSYFAPLFLWRVFRAIFFSDGSKGLGIRDGLIEGLVNTRKDMGIIDRFIGPLVKIVT
jgi:hypothetical protein